MRYILNYPVRPPLKLGSKSGNRVPFDHFLRTVVPCSSALSVLSPMKFKTQASPLAAAFPPECHPPWNVALLSPFIVVLLRSFQNSAISAIAMGQRDATAAELLATRGQDGILNARRVC
jgi:hypothetical protein